MTDRVVVVGGGVAGLATAYRLVRARPDLELTVLEASPARGGRLTSVPVGDLELDAGPDSFVARKPWAVDLCRELGLALVEPATSGAFVWTDRGLIRMPPTALGVPAEIDVFVRWRGLSRAGRARALADLIRKPRPREVDEPLGALLRRRLGDETTELLVAPLLAGLYAGDVDRLGVRSTFPELVGWERDFGGLIRGAKAALRSAKGAGPIFLRPADGVPSLPRSLVDAIGLERVRARSRVTGVAAEGPGYVARAGDLELAANAVVLATPAFAASGLLSDVAPAASARLGEIPYVSTGVVHLVYAEGTADALPDATGFVVPRGKAPMTAATFLSRKWPEPAFGSRAVVRCFVGASGSEDVLDAPDEDIVDAVCRHLAAALPLPGGPVASSVVRWPSSMPQYEVGHLERVEAIEDSLPPGIFVTGNAYHGVGVADAVRGANDVAERVLAHLAGETEGGDRGMDDRTERVR
jgi:protoporphyrinogen/coproporphyrinogen III oxidase